jgi:hypothetical protein
LKLLADEEAKETDADDANVMAMAVRWPQLT